MDVNIAFIILGLIVICGFIIMTIHIMKGKRTSFSGRTLTELLIIANEQYTPQDKVAMFARLLESINWHDIDLIQRDLLIRKLNSIINFLEDK